MGMNSQDRDPAIPASTARKLRAAGLTNVGPVHDNLSPARLTELAVLRKEGSFTDSGAFVASTGPISGRCPDDRYVVEEPSVRDHIWWGPVNHPMDPTVFDRLLNKVRGYLQNRELFILDGWASADPKQRLNVRVIAEKAWHVLFSRCLLLRPPRAELDRMEPGLTIINACGLHADPAVDGTRSDVFIALSLERRIVLIGGTQYAGEIKKSVFSVLNYLLPMQDILSMHCSANIGPKGDTALFFGLSGTGKTTLSADPERRLIGDDEHGWTDQGIFNIEGGCYAKTIRLSRVGEPQIWNAIRYGSILENVIIDPHTGVADYDDESLTENTRAAYPLEFIDNAEVSGQGGHPANVVFLACDAFGVLPPLSKLTSAQALYHFLSGYTAKVAGTEAGVTEPQATFSTCFAAPFLPLHPTRYAKLLHARLEKHGSTVWLVNTGWIEGPPGQGHRISLPHTRALLKAALDGRLDKVAFQPDPIFGVLVPDICPGVPAAILKPRETWIDPSQYDASARKLASLFQANFKKYAAQASEEVRQAGPRE